MSFDHPNLVRFFAAYKDKKRFYIVTELCKGGPLFDIITNDSKKFFTEKDALRVMMQLMQAVSYCHSKDIVHHAIQPTNILMMESEDAGTHQ